MHENDTYQVRYPKGLIQSIDPFYLSKPKEHMLNADTNIVETSEL